MSASLLRVRLHRDNHTRCVSVGVLEFVIKDLGSQSMKLFHEKPHIAIFQSSGARLRSDGVIEFVNMSSSRFYSTGRF